MSFPMLEVFSRDPRRGVHDVVVYEFLWRQLDDKTPMDCTLSWVSHAIALRGDRKISEADVSRALDRLVGWGYFEDHRSDKGKPRSLTLIRVPRRRSADQRLGNSQ